MKNTFLLQLVSFKLGTVGVLKKGRNENFSINSGLKSQVVFLFIGFFNNPTVTYFSSPL